jgi:hypothetical protein
MLVILESCESFYPVSPNPVNPFILRILILFAFFRQQRF